MKNNYKNMRKSEYERAFTLIELIVSIAIATLIMTLVIINYSKFNDDLALSAAVQEVALSIRQAQVYGLSVKESAAGTGNFGYSYGIHFNPSGSTNTKYIIFLDKEADNGYDPGTGCGSLNTECLEEDSLRGGIYISGVCDKNNICNPTTSLDVSFHRPNPDALMCFNTTGSCVVLEPEAKVKLKSRLGSEMTITIEATGQVSIQ